MVNLFLYNSTFAHIYENDLNVRVNSKDFYVQYREPSSMFFFYVGCFYCINAISIDKIIVSDEMKIYYYIIIMN